MFGDGFSPHGSFLFSDGTYGYIGEDSNYDPEDFLEEGETEDELVKDGRKPIGAIISTDGRRRESSSRAGASCTTTGRP